LTIIYYAQKLLINKTVLYPIFLKRVLFFVTLQHNLKFRMALNQSFCIRYQSITANKAHTSERSTFEKRALVGATSPRIFLKSKTSKRFNLERKTRLQIKFTLSNATLMNADNSYTSASRNWRSFAISRDKFSNRKIPRSLITSHGDVQFSRNVSSD
jgi:hypothetical protein